MAMKPAAMTRYLFFQAEDGIRDHCVTGVQTCALPILRRQLSSHFLLKVKSPCVHTVAYAYNIFCSRHSAGTRPLECLFCRSVGVPQALGHEIGRASCRERV